MLETGWSSFCDGQVISRGGCRSDPRGVTSNTEPFTNRRRRQIKKKRQKKTWPDSPDGVVVLLKMTFRRIFSFVAA